MKQKRAGNLATRKRERYKKTTTRIQKVKLCYVSIYGHQFITTIVVFQKADSRSPSKNLQVMIVLD